MGTVFWEVHESITHVVVADGSDGKLRNDVSNFCRYHPNNPEAVSPHWIVASLKAQYLEQPHLFPTLKANALKKENDKDQKKAVPALSRKSDLHLATENNLFHDAVFHFVNSSKHNSTDMITFDAKKVEELVINHGGYILSDQVMAVLQKEREILNNSLTSKHKLDIVCYIVSVNGEFAQDAIIKENELLSTIHETQLCDIVCVNPIWVEACNISNRLLENPQNFPELFQPQWPMFKLPSGVKMKVSVSGFQNFERIGLRELLTAIGATYTDNMGNSNTHLICKEAKGPKYHKAIEWGLHVVTADFLYHIVQYGYRRGGKGCEKNFSLPFSPRRVKPIVNNHNKKDNIKNEAFICSAKDTNDAFVG
eukprot:CAMPEP_0203678320 /NCGR_PEP_ID=MMETSP0090-20130426/31554_1 /ASSEMBLY_ACC=CAM_ASM_001088 /TAXON_ID=426623 /ORGANISM="Chaetoceros affinis, Strain CCMP159" /LENGTH=365 /DNA_ID=CAMNT_0050545517 /DNA_START=198 /DNA_END=1295 /DNA_ORIENTATION=+